MSISISAFQAVFLSILINFLLYQFWHLNLAIVLQYQQRDVCHMLLSSADKSLPFLFHPLSCTSVYIYETSVIEILFLSLKYTFYHQLPSSQVHPFSSPFVQQMPPQTLVPLFLYHCRSVSVAACPLCHSPATWFPIILLCEIYTVSVVRARYMCSSSEVFRHSTYQTSNSFPHSQIIFCFSVLS